MLVGCPESLFLAPAHSIAPLSGAKLFCGLLMSPAFFVRKAPGTSLGWATEYARDKLMAQGLGD